MTVLDPSAVASTNRGLINLRRNRDASSAGVSVIGVFGGLATIAEGMHRLHTAQLTFRHKHFVLRVLTTCVGLLTTTVALMMQRLERRRALVISEDGVGMLLNRFRRFDIPWIRCRISQIGCDDFAQSSSVRFGPTVLRKGGDSTELRNTVRNNASSIYAEHERSILTQA
jgi:hypothetical protein